MDIPDDADGRVAIFTVPAADPIAEAAGSRRGNPIHAAVVRLGTWMDATYAGVAIAAALVAILVVGMVFLRR